MTTVWICRSNFCRKSSAFRLLYNSQRPLSTLRSSKIDGGNSLSEIAISSSPPLSNQDIVRRRLEAQRGKRLARQQSIEQRVQRNLYIKRLLHSGSSSNHKNTDQTTEFQVPPLYAVKVWVDDALRSELRLSGREKRGRVFIETSHNATQTLKGLKQELHGFFRALKKDTFLLRATLPRLSDDGTTILSPETTDQAMEGSWEISTDNDVVKTFRMADDFFQNATLQRPAIQINVLKNPNSPPPSPPPAFLQDMANPNDSATMTMLSFYAFPPSGIDDPETFATDLKRKWKPFQALGRVYVAKEGVNAQMSVPTNVLPNFIECCRSIPQLGQYMENDINIDPQPISQEEFAVAGVPINGQPAPPFRNLHIRVRTQVVADGLNKPLDWQSAGYDMPPLEWHEKLKEAREKRERDQSDAPILLDCRNTYETNVGIFEGAEPLGTDNFRESWDVLKERLADTPKDAPIMTYCTGGIRCVKVGAYLTQELGFTNVSRLAGGIIAYDRTLNEKAQGEESMFKGTNFVFDGRLGRQITDDALANCVTCGAETSLVSNCRNDNCHQRIVQCEACRTSYQGTCSVACKNRVVNGAMTPLRVRTPSIFTPDDEDPSTGKKFDNLDDYSMGHSSPVPSVYREFERNTKSYLASGSHMVSGASQGRLLTQLASMTRNGRILELGTFTGYATACLLEGARNVGNVLHREGISFPSTEAFDNGGPYVLSMERDSRAFNLAAAHLRVIERYGFDGEDAVEAACKLRDEDEVEDVKADVVSVDVDNAARCQLMRVTDALATVEALASEAIIGEILLAAPFDLVFVDADKTRLLEYVEACLSSDRLLKRGGLIVVDNVLWKGLVLEASSRDFKSVTDSDVTDNVEARKNRRARKLATTMHLFNSAIAKDDRVEALILPMRDGLSIMRKK
ncbi:rhodanese domain containing protein [Nitzschia inconspicua]|uniref:Rhodanese domain containing protein n=1 Tax=Nitzschia inconspicua TaxID=303405 RepID=A0A9K3Q6F3_9STRA|nr:rhodanese domain containing protein [Nitzschia inconspicua]